MRRAFLVFIFILVGAVRSQAVLPEEMLADQALEQRAREISQNLRCLVCQNQNIDDSNASLARDLRVIVRERLLAGDSDEAVTGYVVKRYGNYVLLKPPLQADTALLWLLPFMLMFGGLVFAVRYMRQRPSLESTPESEILNSE